MAHAERSRPVSSTRACVSALFVAVPVRALAWCAAPEHPPPPQSTPRRRRSALPRAPIPPVASPSLCCPASPRWDSGQPSPSWAHGRRRPARRWRTSAQRPWRSCGWWICPKTARTHPYVCMRRTAWSRPFSMLPSPRLFLSLAKVCIGLWLSFFVCACVWRVSSLLRWPPGHPLATAVLQRSDQLSSCVPPLACHFFRSSFPCFFSAALSPPA